MPEQITSFSGKYRFLSNFYPAEIHWNGQRWATVEHAFQAGKTLDLAAQARIQAASTPGQAKHLGRRVVLQPDWDDRKVPFMSLLVEQKFRCHPDLKAMLLATEDAELIEGNYWGDRFWGQSPLGVGKNYLGLILMDTRTKLRS